MRDPSSLEPAPSDEEEARALGRGVVELDDHHDLLVAHVSVPPARISRGAPLFFMCALPSTIRFFFKFVTLSVTRSVFPSCRMEYLVVVGRCVSRSLARIASGRC